MAGSLAHIVDDDGKFQMDLIENLGDAHEALEECFLVIHTLTGGDRKVINKALRQLKFPTINVDLAPHKYGSGW